MKSVDTPTLFTPQDTKRLSRHYRLEQIAQLKSSRARARLRDRAELRNERRRVRLEEKHAARRDRRSSRGPEGSRLAWTLALVMTLVIGVVVILTQVGFYRSDLAAHARLVPAFGLFTVDLAYFIPFAVEALGWTCTVLSVLAARHQRPTARYRRYMWLFSGIAASVSVLHNVMTDADLVTAVALGGLSLAVPLVSELCLHYHRDALDGRTPEQVRAQLHGALSRGAAALRRVIADVLLSGARRTLQVLLHPGTAFGALRVVADLPVSWDVAYAAARLGRQKDLWRLQQQRFTEALPTIALAAEPVELPPLVDETRAIAATLTDMTGREALAFAFEFHAEPLTKHRVGHMVKWLARHGKAIDRSNASTYFKSLSKDAGPDLAAG